MKRILILVALAFLLGASTIPPDPEEVTAGIVINICEQYRPIVDQMYEYFPIDPDIVMSVMAKESNCDKWATDGVSVGLMQITPRPWTLREDILWNPKWNIWQGMKMLQANIDNEEENPTHSVSRALAAYNCGWDSLNAGTCIPEGGWNYAAEVLNFWLPRFREAQRSALLGDEPSCMRRLFPSEVFRRNRDLLALKHCLGLSALSY